MSTYYRPTNPIPLKEVKGLNNIKVIYDKKQDKEILFDGTNYLHFACNKNNNIIDIFRYGANNESEILNTLENEFEVNMISEHEEGYQDLMDEDTNVVTIKLEGWGKKNENRVKQKRKRLFREFFSTMTFRWFK